MKPLLSISGALILLTLSCTSTPKKLPILGEREAVQTAGGKTDTIYHTVAPFSFLNQDSTLITEKDFAGKIYVADFFFTSCNTICPIMHRNMLKVYQKYNDNGQVKLLSHSIDVKYDIPSRLKSYATKLGVEGTQWEFVHGNKQSIFKQAAADYLTAAYEDKKDPQGLVHQGWFVLVDSKRRLRGAYDGTKADQVEQLMADMDILLSEENGAQ